MTNSPATSRKAMRGLVAAGLGALLLTAAGCSSSSDVPDGFDGVVTIGSALSESGNHQVSGIDTREGYDTWVTWVNEEYGGIKVGDKRYFVEMIYYDDRSDSEIVVERVDTLLNEDNVDFLFGPYSSGLTAAVAGSISDERPIMMSGVGVSDALYYEGQDIIFQVSTVASEYMATGIRALADAGAQTAVVTHKSDPFSTQVIDGAIRHLSDQNIEVLSVEYFEPDTEDFSGIYGRIAQLQPDIVVATGHFNDSLLQAHAAIETGFWPDGFLLTVGPSNLQFVENLGEFADGMVGPTQWESDMGYEGPYFGTASEYSQYYQQLWDRAPAYQAAASTAAALSLHLAIEHANSLDTEAVRAALKEIEIDTFFGQISYGTRGNNIAREMGSVQVQHGTKVVVAPTEFAVGNFVYPIEIPGLGG